MGDVNPATPVFATWIEFELPATITFEPYPLGGGWWNDPGLLSVFRIYSYASGYRQSDWGRLRERPETVIVISSWKDQQFFVDFKETSEYLRFWTALCELSDAVPTVKQIKSTGGWHRFLKNTISIFNFSFPAPVSDDTKQAVHEYWGLGGSSSLSTFGQSPLSSQTKRPTKAWAIGKETVGERETEFMMYICWWISDKKEEEHCARPDYTLGVNPSGGSRTNLEGLKLDMEEKWAAHWENELHCQLRRLPAFE